MLFFDTKVSLRDQRFLLVEPALMFALIMLYIWRLRMGHQPCALVIFCLMLVSHYRHGESARDLGFRAANFRACFSIFSPALLFVSLLLLAAGNVLEPMRSPCLGRRGLGFPSDFLFGMVPQLLLYPSLRVL